MGLVDVQARAVVRVWDKQLDKAGQERLAVWMRSTGQAREK